MKTTSPALLLLIILIFHSSSSFLNTIPAPRKYQISTLSLSSVKNINDNGEINPPPPPPSSVRTSENGSIMLNVLALHGKGSSAALFEKTLVPFVTTAATNGLQLDIDYLDAPFAGGQWWTLPPNTRSFNAKSYQGFDVSAMRTLEALRAKKYDFILGHSQGAILLSAMIDDVVTTEGLKGVILNGAAWPNPFTTKLEGFSIVVDGEGDGELSASCANGALPRVLFVMGDNDDINPVEGAERVRDALIRGGLIVSVCRHGGGHGVPVKNDTAVEEILNWVTMVTTKKSIPAKM